MFWIHGAPHNRIFARLVWKRAVFCLHPNVIIFFRIYGNCNLACARWTAVSIPCLGDALIVGCKQRFYNRTCATRSSIETIALSTCLTGLIKQITTVFEIPVSAALYKILTNNVGQYSIHETVVRGLDRGIAVVEMWRIVWFVSSERR